MGLMDERERLVILVFPAVKGLRDQMVYKASRDQRETLALTDRKEIRVILEKLEKEDVLETTALLDHRETVAHLEQTETKANAATMVKLEQMAAEEKEVKLERKGSKVLVETEAPEERGVNQDPGESKEGRAQPAPTETLVSPGNKVLLATEAMRAPLDQRDPKGREESKELQETEA